MHGRQPASEIFGRGASWRPWLDPFENQSVACYRHDLGNLRPALDVQQRKTAGFGLEEVRWRRTQRLGK